jgi:hypothetical protein
MKRYIGTGNVLFEFSLSSLVLGEVRNNIISVRDAEVVVVNLHSQTARK